MRQLLICALLLLPLRAEVIDKLAITVDHNVITELAVDEDLRVVALLNGQQVTRNLETRRAAADRLVQRLLIQHEMELSRYPLPTRNEVAIYLQQVQTSLGGEAHFPALLASYDLSQATVVEYLRSQLTMLRFIDYRFSPDATVTESDVDAIYQRQLAESARSRPAIPTGPLDDAKRKQLSQQLVEERTDAALNSWLAESRKQVNIAYLDTALQ